jgi:hypothetical protein
MKTVNHLLAAAAAVATLTLTASAQTAGPLFSPRGADLRHELRKAPSAPSDIDLTKDRPNGNARGAEHARSLRTVPSSGRSIDLAHAPRPTLSPRDPRFESAWRENAIEQFQVAPVK